MAPKRKHPLTIVLAATKGGVGKTTLASALAVRASADGSRVALLDTDPQRSLDRWHELRGKPANPRRLSVDGSIEALRWVQEERFDYLIVDTPPMALDRIEAAIHIADLVLIPCKASILDIEAVSDVVSICRRQGKMFCFVINQVPESGFARLVTGARLFLAEDGPVLEQQIALRKSHVAAMTEGRSAAELEDKVAAKEIAALWGELMAMAKVRHVQ